MLYDIRLIDDVLSLAERISDRMFALNGGRLWMGAHMRRGDCRLFFRLNPYETTHGCTVARLGWSMDADFGVHLARIKTHLQSGREVLVSMHGGKANAYDVPDAHPDPLLVTLDPPNPDDK